LRSLTGNNKPNLKTAGAVAQPIQHSGLRKLFPEEIPLNCIWESLYLSIPALSPVKISGRESVLLCASTGRETLGAESTWI